MAQQRWRSLACSMSLESMRHAASAGPTPKRGFGLFGARSVLSRGPVASVPTASSASISGLAWYWEVKGAINPRVDLRILHTAQTRLTRAAYAPASDPREATLEVTRLPAASSEPAMEPALLRKVEGLVLRTAAVEVAGFAEVAGLREHAVRGRPDCDAEAAAPVASLEVGREAPSASVAWRACGEEGRDR